MIFLTMLPEIIIHIRTIDHFPYEYIFFIIGYCLSLHNLGINSMKFFHIAFSYFESSYWNSVNYLYTFLEIILSPVSSKLFLHRLLLFPNQHYWLSSGSQFLLIPVLPPSYILMIPWNYKSNFLHNAQSFLSINFDKYSLNIADILS